MHVQSGHLLWWNSLLRGEERPEDITYLDFSRVFDTAFHSNFAGKPLRYGLDTWTIICIENCLNWLLVVNGSKSFCLLSQAENLRVNTGTGGTQYPYNWPRWLDRSLLQVCVWHPNGRSCTYTGWNSHSIIGIDSLKDLDVKNCVRFNKGEREFLLLGQ